MIFSPRNLYILRSIFVRFLNIFKCFVYFVCTCRLCFQEFSKDYEIQIRPRSGLAAKKNITVLNTPGTIDSDYRGEIKVILINLGEQDFEIENGLRIAQMVISPTIKAELEEVEQISKTLRDKGGFGSTGLK